MKTSLALTAAGLLAGALSVSAQTVDVTVDGNPYAVSTITDTVANQIALLAAQPWYGNQSLANDFATAVGSSLGSQGPGSGLYGQNVAPIFYVGGASDISAVDYYNVLTDIPYTPQSNPYTFAIATSLVPVPESATNPGLLAAAGLFIIWQGWRRVGAARA